MYCTDGLTSLPLHLFLLQCHGLVRPLAQILGISVVICNQKDMILLGSEIMASLAPPGSAYYAKRRIEGTV